MGTDKKARQIYYLSIACQDKILLFCDIYVVFCKKMTR